MDNNATFVLNQQISRTRKHLENNNMNTYFANSIDELQSILSKLTPDNSVVSVGGSMTLFELGIIDYLKNRPVNFLNRYEKGLTKEDIDKIYRDTFSADVYFCSANAITEDGCVYNVDGNGNRVAAIMFGPKKVVMIAGINKIVPTVEDAIKRNERIAAPANTKRLDRKTPCATTGLCSDCSSPDRICSKYTLLKQQLRSDRIHIILYNDRLGY